METIIDQVDDTAVSYKAWKKAIRESYSNRDNYVVDNITVEYLRDITDAYMLDHVGRFCGNVVTILPVRISSSEELETFKQRIQSDMKRIVLNTVLWYPPAPVVKENKVIVSDGYWVIYCAEINPTHTTVSVEDWQATLANDVHTVGMSGTYINDESTAAYLAPVVESYLTVPVGTYNARPVNVTSLKCKNIQEIVDFKKRLIADGKKILLYRVNWHYPTPMYGKLDDEFNVVSFGDNPQMSVSFWNIRYVELPN